MQVGIFQIFLGAVSSGEKTRFHRKVLSLSLISKISVKCALVTNLKINFQTFFPHSFNWFLLWTTKKYYFIWHTQKIATEKYIKIKAFKTSIFLHSKLFVAFSMLLNEILLPFMYGIDICAEQKILFKVCGGNYPLWNF